LGACDRGFDAATNLVVPQAQSLSFSRNGEILLAGGGRGGESGSVLMFNARTGELIDQVGEERDTILTADLSSDQSLIAIGSPNKRVGVMTSAGNRVHELTRHTDWVTAVGFSPDGHFFATADRNGSLLLWETESPRRSRHFTGAVTAGFSLLPAKMETSVYGTARTPNQSNRGMLTTAEVWLLAFAAMAPSIPPVAIA